MKKILFFVIISISPAIGFGVDNFPSNDNNAQYVYICTGPKSKTYHKYDDCKGLERCSKDIVKVSLDKGIYVANATCAFLLTITGIRSLYKNVPINFNNFKF